MQPTFAPLSNIKEALHAFHVTAHDRNQVTPTYHYCACLPADSTSDGLPTPPHGGMRQCLLYASSAPDAKLIGVEFLLDAGDFLALPAEEKRFWHSHRHEVESGVLCLLGMRGAAGATVGGVAEVLPRAANPGGGLPDAIERPFLETIYKMYGKIFHFYEDPYTQAVPLGPPTLMMSTTDQQPSVADPASPLHTRLTERDAVLGVDSAKKAAERAGWLHEFRQHLHGDAVESMGAADDWERTGRVPKLVAEDVAVMKEEGRRA